VGWTGLTRVREKKARCWAERKKRKLGQKKKEREGPERGMGFLFI
jgi:hypothetical protein